MRAGAGAAQGRPGAGVVPAGKLADVIIALPTLASLKRDATSLDSAVSAGVLAPAASPCSAEVTIRGVGDCDGTPALGSFAQNCHTSPRDAHKAIMEYVKHKGLIDVREFRNAGAQLLDGASFFPHEVWALR